MRWAPPERARPPSKKDASSRFRERSIDGATAIGASVKRTEDIRFITGKGHYVDDVNRPGQAYAFFCARRTLMRRSTRPTRQPRRNPRGGGDLHRRRHRGRQGRRPHLRLDDPFEGRIADESGRAPGARAGQGALRRRSCRRRHRRHARPGARRSRKDRGQLHGVAGRGRHGEGGEPGQPQLHDVAPKNTIFNWHIGDKATTDAAFAAAAHVTKLDLVNNRLIPNAMEPRAAVAEYDLGTDAMTLFTTSQNRMWRDSSFRPSSGSRPSTS